jgi:hypothetical protein
MIHRREWALAGLAVGLAACARTVVVERAASTGSGGATASASAGGGGGGTPDAGVDACGILKPFLACAAPEAPPTGACVPVDVGDAGELDAGVYNSGTADNPALCATMTTCNPVTNAGCTGNDTCVPDHCMGEQNVPLHYYCAPPYSLPYVPPCSTCYSLSTCAPGSLCIVRDAPCTTGGEYICARACCTDADCVDGVCSPATLDSWPTPYGVGVCIMQ